MAVVAQKRTQSRLSGAASFDPFRTALYGALFFIAVGVGAALSNGLLRLPLAATTAEDVAAEIDALSRDNPGVGAMFAALKTHYPAAFAALTARAAGAMRKGDIKGAEAAAFETTRALSKSKFAHLSHASPDRLQDWGKSALAVMNAAQREAPRLCAAVAFGTVDRAAATSAPSLANAVGRHAAAAIIAFREGEIAPYDHAKPSPAEQAVFARTVAAQGMSAREAGALGRADAIRALSEAEQCALGIKLLKGVVATPEPARSRILSMMAGEAARQL